MRLIELPNGNILNLSLVRRIYRNSNNGLAIVVFSDSESWYDVCDYEKLVTYLYGEIHFTPLSIWMNVSTNE